MKLFQSCLAVLLSLTLFSGCTMTIPPNLIQATTAPPVNPEAAHWQTWVLPSSDALRPAPPPDATATSAELTQLKEAMATGNANDQSLVTYWDAGSPPYRWIEIALAQYRSGPPNPYVARAMALVNVALYDATIASWEAKYTYNRSRPSGVASLIPMPNTPSYPSTHAAAAGAAATVLAYLVPEQADFFAAKAEEAGQSRLLAGVAYPSDVAAGLALGRAVGEKVIEWAKTDGSDAKWTDEVPTGLGMWQGDQPVTPLAGTWRTWVLSSGDQFRSPPPPAYDSTQTQSELSEIKSVTRTFPIISKSIGWHTFDAAYPYWFNFASQRMFERRLDDDAPLDALIYASTAIAEYDAVVACFDGKYAYWRIRPPQLDPEVTTLFATPPHPSYPAAHACASYAKADVLASFFPADADTILAAAQEAGNSRIWAGIHYRSDVDAGAILGKSVAQAVLERVNQMTHP